MMARLVVLSSPALADGFRLAGATTIEALPGLDLNGLVRAQAADPDVGLLLVTEDLWSGLDGRLRGALERLARPVVLSVPIGEVSDATTRRRELGEMLARAIGYRIELTGALTGGASGGGEGR